MKKQNDNNGVLIVGAGLSGITIARILAENNIKVTVIEKRNHLAGNIFDYKNNYDERIHKYGPHLLHCNSKSASLAFLSRFTEWIKYEHKVKALLKDGRTTPLPVNKTTLEDVYNKKFNSEIEVEQFLESIRDKEIIPKNTDEFFQSKVGNKIADIFFRPYTKKMWGLDPKMLEISIGARLPVRTNDDDRYFNDNFQALPKEGYTYMIEKMINHKNIKVLLNKSYINEMESDFEHAFLCIPIDKFFNYRYGKLPYRSIIFEDKKVYLNNQNAPVINFTDNSKYTRKTQWNLFPNSGGIQNEYKTITYEIPCSMEENPNEYYYPVHTKESIFTYNKYKLLASRKNKITFCGRTGLFKYIDMIPAVSIHRKIANDFLKNSKKI